MSFSSQLLFKLSLATVPLFSQVLRIKIFQLSFNYSSHRVSFNLLLPYNISPFVLSILFPPTVIIMHQYQYEHNAEKFTFLKRSLVPVLTILFKHFQWFSIIYRILHILSLNMIFLPQSNNNLFIISHTFLFLYFYSHFFYLCLEHLSPSYFIQLLPLI